MTRAQTPDITLDGALARALKGETSPLEQWASADPASTLAAIERHGVGGVIELSLPAGGADAAFIARLAASRHAAIVSDLVSSAELRHLTTALATAGVRALIMKGAQLAHSLYPRPDQRPRLDTDLLIASGDRAVADGVLRNLAYAPQPTVGGDLVLAQISYVKRRQDADVHVVDLHWRIANPHVFAEMLSHAELEARAIPLPRLGAHARGLAPVDALLVACVHRIAHHQQVDRLVWMYDIHLLARTLSDDDWDTFAARALDRHVGAICHQGLARAAAACGTRVPDRVVAALDPAAATRSESSARYLAPLSPTESLVQDLRHLTSWRSRLRLVRQHLLPARAYMRDVYAPARRTPLVVLYAERACRGARRWLRRPRAMAMTRRDA